MEFTLKMQNERGSFPFDVRQIQEKFQRYINRCCEAAIKIKTKSGIQKL